MKNKLVCIVGPTGVGKTELALSLTKKLNGTLISADSIQVFKGLDIISGKDKPNDTSLTPRLVDILPPTKSYSAYEFVTEASKEIAQIMSLNKLPILVGGTGLYIKSLIDGLDIPIKPNMKLRLSLEKLTVEKLQKKLQEINREKFESLNNSDKKNPRRLIRAIEILRSKKKELSIKEENAVESLVIGLYCDRETLKLKIDQRVKKRIEQGALKEAEKLFKNYESLTPQVKNANGYKQLFNYLKNETTLDDAIYRWKISEYKHAKNQMTWFKKYGNVTWFDIHDAQFRSKIEKFIASNMQLI